MSLEITDQTLDDVLGQNKLVVIDFWAAWCGPCRMLGPIVDSLASEYDDVIIGKVDVTENPRTSMAYGITSIPSIVFIKDGKEVGRQRGVVPRVVLQKLINDLKN